MAKYVPKWTDEIEAVQFPVAEDEAPILWKDMPEWLKYHIDIGNITYGMDTTRDWNYQVAKIDIGQLKPIVVFGGEYIIYKGVSEWGAPWVEICNATEFEGTYREAT